MKGDSLKTKGLLAYLLGLTAVLVAATAGCSPKEPVQTTAVANDKTYNCLDPRGIQIAIETRGLAPRQNKLESYKVIYVNQGEADPIIMPALWLRVQKDHPTITWKYITTNSFGPAIPEQEVLDAAKAVIRGISW
jgi:hypothetical protein